MKGISQQRKFLDLKEENLTLAVSQNQNLRAALDSEKFLNNRVTEELTRSKNAVTALVKERDELYFNLSAKENLIRELYNHMGLLEKENQTIPSDPLPSSAV